MAETDDRETTGKTTALIPQPHGGALKPGGTPGNKGGRPSNEFTEWCRDLITDPKSAKQVELILKDRKHPAFATMWKQVVERGFGKVPDSLELSGKDGGPVETLVRIRVVKPEGE